jgi:2'-5' RNA ligase
VRASGGRFAIALGLDEPTSAVVRRLRQNLAYPRPEGAEPPPHLTLAAWSGLNADSFRLVAAQLAGRTRPLACTLASIGVFPTHEGVLFLTPAISADLVQLQLVVLDRLRQSGVDVEPYWMPGHWVPHCTLAIGIPREIMAAAVGQTLTNFHPIAGHLVRLSVYAIDPPGLCYEFPLGGP